MRRAGEMGQWLRALTALPEGLIPSTSIMVHNCRQPQLQGLIPLLASMGMEWRHNIRAGKTVCLTNCKTNNKPQKIMTKNLDMFIEETN